MGQLINDMVRGFVFLAVTVGGYGMVSELGSRAVDAHKVGLMSYSKYTKILTEKRVGRVPEAKKTAPKTGLVLAND